MKCTATSKTGSPCKMPATASGYCFAHDPDLEAERESARKRGGFNRRRRKIAETPPEIRLQTIADAITALELALADTIAQENSHRRSRTIGYLAATALRAIELRTLGDLETRVAALENMKGPA